MKISIAAQVLSNNVASVMKSMTIRNDASDSLRLPKEAESTAEFIPFMDKVFNSVNGSQIKISRGKDLKFAVSSKTGHQMFWCEAKNVFRLMHFCSGKDKIITSSLKN